MPETSQERGNATGVSLASGKKKTFPVNEARKESASYLINTGAKSSLRRQEKRKEGGRGKRAGTNFGVKKASRKLRDPERFLILP